MGEFTGISWCDHTFNLGWGCFEKSEGCAHCYARDWAKRYGFDVWGKDKKPRIFDEKHWNEPLKWNKKAGQGLNRKKVFCGSMMDWTDDVWAPYLPGLWELWEQTPNLIWLMLTKNADKIKHCLPPDWLVSWDDNYRGVWLGVTTENQKRYDERIFELLKIPSTAHWISAEPLLGPINILDKLRVWGKGHAHHFGDSQMIYPLNWIIVGGESGPKRRFFDPNWARQIRDDCFYNGISFFMKQIDKVQPIPDDLLIRESPHDPYQL